MSLSIEASGTNFFAGTTYASGAQVASGIQTTGSSDIIYVFYGRLNYSGAPTIIDSLSQLTFYPRIAQVANATSATSGIWAQSWYAVTNAPYGPGNITVYGGLSGVVKAGVFVISVAGVNTTTPFDSNGSVPLTASGAGRVGSGDISTSNANDIILGFRYANLSGGAGHAASGFTGITTTYTGQLSGVSAGAEYLIVSNTVTNQVVSFVSGSSSAHWILLGDAIVQSTPVTPSAVYFPLQPLVIGGGLF